MNSDGAGAKGCARVMLDLVSLACVGKRLFWATDGLVVAAGVDATTGWAIFKPGVAMFWKGLLASVALCMGLGAAGCCTCTDGCGWPMGA